jgi:hypothetical protein
VTAPDPRLLASRDIQAAAARRAGRDPVLHELWHVHPNDVDGGWTILNRSMTPAALSALGRDADPGARVVCETRYPAVALYIATLHNLGLHLEDEAGSG